MHSTVLCVGSRSFEREALGLDLEYQLISQSTYRGVEGYLSVPLQRDSVDLLLTRFGLDNSNGKDFIDQTSSGLAVISRARSLGYTKPILLVEHSVSVGLLRKVRELGGTGCIENPFPVRYHAVWDELVHGGISPTLDTYFSQSDFFIDHEANMIKRLDAERHTWRKSRGFTL